MALVPLKTSTGTGYCDCICGCYDLCALRDDELNRSFCYRCAEEHLERNRELVARIRKPSLPEKNFSPLPPGAKPPALKKS